MKRVTAPSGLVLGLIIGLLSALGAIPAREARATEVGTARSFGLGFALGEPTDIAIVGKYFIDSSNALDFGLGFYDWNDDDRCWWDSRRVRHCNDGLSHVSLHLDYLWQDNLARGTAKLDWYIGAGGRLWIFDDNYRGWDDDNDLALAARMPVGLALSFDRPSFLEVFLELAPALYIIPDLDLELEAFIGVRFFF
jgi:hypothetical protein